jgi:hypothetical protein
MPCWVLSVCSYLYAAALVPMGLIADRVKRTRLLGTGGAQRSLHGHLQPVFLFFFFGEAPPVNSRVAKVTVLVLQQAAAVLGLS